MTRAIVFRFALVLGICTANGALAQNSNPSSPAAASDFSLSANVSLASQYRFRGLMQTNNKPAIQGGFDSAHSSGFYLGNWNSNISWLSDSASNPRRSPTCLGRQTARTVSITTLRGIFRRGYGGLCLIRTSAIKRFAT